MTTHLDHVLAGLVVRRRRRTPTAENLTELDRFLAKMVGRRRRRAGGVLTHAGLPRQPSHTRADADLLN